MAGNLIPFVQTVSSLLYFPSYHGSSFVLCVVKCALCVKLFHSSLTLHDIK